MGSFLWPGRLDPRVSRLPDHTTHVLVIGPGAIGAFVAARLSKAGLPVTVACRTRQSADHVTSHGVVSVDHEGVETVARAQAVTEPEELKDPPRIVFLATKCADAVTALRRWIDVIPHDTPIVSLQNGLMGDILAPLVPGRYVDTVVHFPASLEGTARSVQTGPGGFDVGLWDVDGRRSGSPEHAALAAGVLGLAAEASLTPNIEGAKWTKLIINSAMTTLGVVGGTTLGELLGDKAARDAFLAVADEGYRAGRAEGIRFETVQRFDPARFALDGGGAIKRAALHTVLRILARKYTRHRSSSLQSLERGMRTEVDHLNGVIVATGRRRGVETPVNAALVDIVHDIEAGDIKPDLALMRRLPTPSGTAAR